MNDKISLAMQSPEPIRVQLGEIAVTDSWVSTPAGSYPLRGTTWTVANQTYVNDVIPGWAIGLAVVFFIFCLLGLLFLTIKEKRVHGTIGVTVQGPDFSYSTLIPARHEGVQYQVTQQVNWIRAQVAHLSA